VNKASRSPIKAPPLRLAGQSLQAERDALFDGPVLYAGTFAMLAIVMAVMEWIRYFNQTPPNPWFYTAVAAITVFGAAWVIGRAIPRIRALRQGMIGERAVGQFLERLREQGYHVYHDVVGPNFNIDHVLIGPAGIFTIETKTWSKPAKGDARVVCTGDKLRVGAFESDRGPIVQAKAQSSWLRQILAESTGRALAVQPVVVFPGWYVEQDAESRRHAWVLEPKALPTFLEKAQQRLAAEEIHLVSYHLARFIRSVERART
jgi:Nuclease-related domain